jgi:hypothetical protein
MVVDTRSVLPINKFDLYFRCYLLVKYYNDLFAEINRELISKYNKDDQVKYFIYHFNPESSCPEGKLFQILAFLVGNQNNPA